MFVFQNSLILLSCFAGYLVYFGEQVMEIHFHLFYIITLPFLIVGGVSQTAVFRKKAHPRFNKLL